MYDANPVVNGRANFYLYFDNSIYVFDYLVVRDWPMMMFANHTYKINNLFVFYSHLFTSVIYRDNFHVTFRFRYLWVRIFLCIFLFLLQKLTASWLIILHKFNNSDSQMKIIH